MSDDPVAEITTAQIAGQIPAASIDAITMLIHSFGTMIASMERRITDRIADNAQASKERWGRWERDFEKYQQATDRRLELLEDRVGAMVSHDEHEDLVWDARLSPIRNSGVWLGRHWRDVLLLILGILAVLGFSSETIQRVVS